MEYNLMLIFGITIGISIMIPISVGAIKQKEKFYEERVRKLEEIIYEGRKNNNI